MFLYFSKIHLLYFFQSDRILSCWTLSDNSEEKNAVANLVMEDVAVSVTVLETAGNDIQIAAVTRNGVTHIYHHTLNGYGNVFYHYGLFYCFTLFHFRKCGKPLKPKVTLQVAADSGQSKDIVSSIPILAARFQNDASLLIAYGSNFITFENVVRYKKFLKLQIEIFTALFLSFRA